jgi:hypothetical protein
METIKASEDQSPRPSPSHCSLELSFASYPPVANLEESLLRKPFPLLMAFTSPLYSLNLKPTLKWPGIIWLPTRMHLLYWKRDAPIEDSDNRSSNPCLVSEDCLRNKRPGRSLGQSCWAKARHNAGFTCSFTEKCRRFSEALSATPYKENRPSSHSVHVQPRRPQRQDRLLKMKRTRFEHPKTPALAVTM